ncbi:ComF family protein, partial [Rugamonas sp. FT82W]
RSLGVALHARLACRVRETAAQSGVTPERRRHNIAGAFAIPDMALVQGRHIGVVDDVMTSGATLNELAATLKRHGAAQVSNLVFARTPPH